MSQIAPTSPEPLIPEDRRAFRQGDVDQAYEDQHGLCNRCPTPLLASFIRDHIRPRDLGGETTRANLQLLCYACDTAKTAEDRRRIDKARRQRFKHETPRADYPPTQTIKSAGFRRRQWGDRT